MRILPLASVAFGLLLPSLAGQSKPLPGLVQSADGKPLADAEIRVFDLLVAPQLRPRTVRAPLPLYTTKAGDDGRFTLRKLPPGGAMVEIEKPGFYTHITPYTGDLPALVVKLTPGASIAGTAVDADGKPAPATITVYYEGSVDHQEHETDAAGRFRFNKSHRGDYVLRLRSHAGRLSASSERFEKPRQDLRIEFPRSRLRTPPIAVRAQDEAKQPIKTFRAYAKWDSRGRRVASVNPENYVRNLGQDSNDAGLALVRGPTSRQGPGGLVLAMAKGYLPSTTVVEFEELAHEEGTAHRLATITFVKAGTFTGKLLDQSGKPLPDATVETVGSTRVINRSGKPLDALPRTAADGSFRVDQPGTGNYKLVFRKDGLVVSIHETRGKAGRETDAGELRAQLSPVTGQILGLPENSEISITDPDAAPPRRTTAAMPSQLQPPRGPRVRPDAAGKYHAAAIPDGRFDLNVVLRQPVGEPVTVRIQGIRVKGTTTFEPFALTNQLGRVTGEITFKRTAVPSHRVLISLEPVVLRRRVGALRPLAGPRTLLRKDGSFEIHAPPGDYHLRIADLATGVILHRAEAETVRGGETLTKNLKLALGLVRVKLQPEDDLPTLSHLSIQVGDGDPNIAEVTALAYAAMRGLPLAPGTAESELILPLEECTIRAWNGQIWMGLGRGRLGVASSGEVTVQPKLEAPVRTELRCESK